MDTVYLLSEAGLKKAAQLFAGSHETLIRSALEGAMGEKSQVYGNHRDCPTAVRADTGDFAIFAGDPAAAGELIAGTKVPLFCPAFPEQEKVWEAAFRDKFPELETFNRYAFYHDDPTAFDRKKLQEFRAALPAGFTLREIDRELYERCRAESWSQDLVGNFLDAEIFCRDGLGIVVVAPDGELAAGASSYSIYRGGIEIEVDTRKSYRQMGLGRAVSAALILRCLEGGLYPSWDAANLISVRLAQSLGYREKGEYHVWYEKSLDPAGTAASE